MNKKNPYEYLKIDCLDDIDPIAAPSSWAVTNGRQEQIHIMTAPLPDGFWAYGYVVCWHNGRTSKQKPTASLGKFRSEREARLYAVGFMLIYLDFFVEDTRAALKIAEQSLLQAHLIFE